MKFPDKNVSPQTWIIVSAVGFLLFLGAALALIFFSDKIGYIKPQIYFFLLVILGLVCAAFLSGAMKSQAKYSGRVYGGTLELGGPIVVLVILVFLGYKFMPKKDMFPLKFTVFGAVSKNEVVSSGLLKIFLSKPDSQRIENGFSSFTDIDTKYQGKKIDILATAQGYYPLSQNIEVPFENMPVELFMQRRPDSVVVSGVVINKNGQPVKNALVVFENGMAKETSDDLGNFKTMLPIKEGKEINIRVYDAQKLKYNNAQIVSGTAGLTLQLQ